ncbi:MAG: glycosyltransferase family 2 protein [Candidatus Omnitrophota bacterium]
MEKLVDIILLSYENPELLKKCVRSVLEHTKVSSRLIIVDNASREPEVELYLQGLHGNDNVAIEKIFSEENAGFAAGMNKGMRLSGAPFLCLLNNDCVVTKGWLEEMITVAESRDDIGLVNPQSNTFGSLPDGRASVDEHAALLGDKKGKFVELGHAIGFACLVKREVVERIGYLDEAYRGVCYEDTDFSVRAQKAGFIAVMAEGAYVSHVEQASRRNLKGVEQVYQRNREIFEGKWGRLLRVFYLENFRGNTEEILSRYETLKGLARERAIIEMWIDGKNSFGESFSQDEDKRPTRHADINVNDFPKRFTGPAVIWRVLTKKKKYDAVIMEDGFLLRFLRFLKPLHRVDVFSIGGDMRARSAEGREFDLKEPFVLAEYLRKKVV